MDDIDGDIVFGVDIGWCLPSEPNALGVLVDAGVQIERRLVGDVPFDADEAECCGRAHSPVSIAHEALEQTGVLRLQRRHDQVSSVLPLSLRTIELPRSLLQRREQLQSTLR